MRTHRTAGGCAEDAENHAEGAGVAENAHEAVLRTQEGIRGSRGRAECAWAVKDAERHLSGHRRCQDGWA